MTLCQEWFWKLDFGDIPVKSLLCGTVGSELASGSHGSWFESLKTQQRYFHLPLFPSTFPWNVIFVVLTFVFLLIIWTIFFLLFTTISKISLYFSYSLSIFKYDFLSFQFMYEISADCKRFFSSILRVQPSAAYVMVVHTYVSLMFIFKYLNRSLSFQKFFLT